jgi:putative transposase
VLLRSIESGQYLAIRYTERLAEVGVTNSVGSKGDSFDCEDPGAVVEPSLAGSPTSLLGVA